MKGQAMPRGYDDGSVGVESLSSAEMRRVAMKGDAVPDIGLLEGVGQSISALKDDAYDLVSMLQGAADRTFGARLEGTTAAAEKPHDGGELASIQRQLSRLQSALSELREQARRFTAL